MKRSTTPLGFAIKFALLFGLLYFAWESARDTSFEELIIRDAVLAPSAAVINWISPREMVQVNTRSIVSSGSRLRVTRGCEGTEMLMILTAALLAFPASLGTRARGFIFGAALAYVLTILRIVVLHFTLRYSRDAWDLLHGMILPLGPVVLIALYFLHWSSGVQANRPAHPAHAA